MFSNAIALLSSVYEDWLGTDAPDAAALAHRHVIRGQPAENAATLQRLGSFLERLLRAFCTRYAPDPAEYERIATHVGGLWLHAVRAAVRAGRPWLATYYGAGPALQVGCRP